MPHPAILIDERETQTVGTKSIHVTGWPPGGATTEAQATRLVRYRKEPASTRNPIREDGTRAPAPYYVRRIYFGQKSSFVKTVADPGFWGWINGPTKSQCDAWHMLFGSGGAYAFSQLHTPDRVWVESKARTQFLNKLADASGKDSWELGVVAGEFRETAGMAADLAGSLLSGVRSIARSTKRPPKLVADTLRVYGESGPRAALRQVAGLDTTVMETIVQAWLVKQFGIDPLISDLFNASVQLNAKMTDPVKGAETFATVVRGGAEDTFKYRIQTANAYVNGLCGLDCYVDLQEVVRYSFAAKYQIPVKPTVMQRLGLYNPVHVAAQLTRFSWMADYVTNLSKWLRAMMAGEDCKFIEGSRSMLCKTTAERGYSEGTFSQAVVDDPMKSPFVLSSDWFERELIPPVGVMPSFLPGVKNRLNVTRLANSIAALTTLVGARSRPGPPVITH